jgi:transcriptional regulator with XRE-family HTH domain
MLILMKNASLARRLGALIRHLRLEAGLSQEEFADLCGLHRTYIGLIERGEKTVTIETAQKIARALKMPLSQLFLQLEREEVESNKNHDDE